MTLISKREAAARVRLSEKTLDRHIAREDLPVIRLGRRVLIRETDLEAWIAKAGVPTGAKALETV